MLTMMLVSMAIAAAPTVSKRATDIARIERQLVKHASKRAVPAKELAPVIYSLARKYNVSQKLIVQVVMQESRGDAAAYNARTNDCGLGQINKRTAALYHKRWTVICDEKNWRSNLELGVQILATTTRPCAYNQGPRIRNIEKCLNYERRLASIN